MQARLTSIRETLSEVNCRSIAAGIVSDTDWPLFTIIMIIIAIENRNNKISQ